MNDIAAGSMENPKASERASNISLTLSGILLVAGLSLNLYGASQLDPDRIGDLGIVTILHWPSWAGLALLVFGFAISIHGNNAKSVLPWLFLFALVLALHAVPAHVYGTLRYSWAWKHIGVVDYLQRHHAIDRTASFLSAYHNWPGFFLVSALFADLFRLDPVALSRVVSYTPPVLNMLYLLILFPLFRRMTDDRRMIFLAMAIFLGGNWIGQDYFSPQGTVYFLYLAAMWIIMVPLERPLAAPDTARRLPVRLYLILCNFINKGLPENTARAHGPRGILAALALMAIIFAIAATHQLTPIVIMVSLAGFVIAGRLDPGYALFALLINVAWILNFAAPFASEAMSSQVAAFGDALINATDKLADLHRMSHDQAIVSMFTRALTASIVLTGLLGFVRRFLCGHIDGPALILAAAPLPMVVATSYGGEAIFRVYLFALPAFAFLAAGLVFPSPKWGRSPVWIVFNTIILGALIFAFMMSNNGKDMQYRFRPTEVAAANWLYSTAPPGSLLVEGARNYPSQFRNYENFTYLPIANESAQTIREILKAPADTLDRWLSGDQWTDGYVILTRSQQMYLEVQGYMEPGEFAGLEKALAASPRFSVAYRNKDAVIFKLNKLAPQGSD